MKRLAGLFGLSLLALTVYWWLFAMPSIADYAIPDSQEAIERGGYLVTAGGCISCHEDPEGGEGLSGGMALITGFGTFHASNITPHPETGIGGWSGRDFVRALKHGRGPDGRFYFPAFPYRAYAGLSNKEVLDIAAWLLAQKPVASRPPANEMPFWLQRWQLAGWNHLAGLSESSRMRIEDPQVRRGAHLARDLGHCGECHTPRNSLGILQHEREFAGARLGDDDIPAIDAEALADWSEEDFALFLFLGLKPDDEYVGGEMEPVIEHNTSQLTEADRNAMAAFFIRGQRGG